MTFYGGPLGQIKAQKHRAAQQGAQKDSRRKYVRLICLDLLLSGEQVTAPRVKQELINRNLNHMPGTSISNLHLDLRWFWEWHANAGRCKECGQVIRVRVDDD